MDIGSLICNVGAGGGAPAAPAAGAPTAAAAAPGKDPNTISPPQPQKMPSPPLKGLTQSAFVTAEEEKKEEKKEESEESDDDMGFGLFD